VRFCRAVDQIFGHLEPNIRPWAANVYYANLGRDNRAFVAVAKSPAARLAERIAGR